MWEFDLVGVDLMGVDLVGVDLVEGHLSFNARGEPGNKATCLLYS